MLTVARAGDVVVLPAPWYFNHKMTLEMLGIEARPLQTEAADGFLPSVEGLEAALDPHCRALVLVSPNNPTGAVYPPSASPNSWRSASRAECISSSTRPTATSSTRRSASRMASSPIRRRAKT